MKKLHLRRLEENESLEDFIPEIIRAFEQDGADVVYFIGSRSEKFKVTIFDFKVYKSLSSPELRNAYMCTLLYRQACDEYNEPEDFASALESFYNSTREDAVKQHLAALVNSSDNP